MSKKHDDGESIWDALMKPASMDYNFDGKIDDLDLYIEMDELDKALGQGKYDYYNDPYVIAQREREAAKELEDKDDKDGNSDDDFDEEAYMNEVPSMNLLEDEEDDDDYDEEDDGDYNEDYDEEMDDLFDSYEPYNDESSEKIITLEFSFHDKREEERKKFPATGIWQYYDKYGEWHFIKALYTFDKQLKEDCGTKYDESEEQIGMILNDIYQFDKERAIADWDWLLKTFPAKTLNSTNEYTCGEPFSCQLGIRVLSFLYHDDGDNKLLTEYLKQDYVFNYLVVDSVWEKGNQFYFADLLSCYAVADCDDLFKKCYKTVLNTQKHCISNKFLAEVWEAVRCDTYWGNVSVDLIKYIKSEITKIGDFGKPILKTIVKEEAEIEKHRRWEEEKRMEEEQEAAEAEERRLEEEREAAERAEREQQIKILEEISAPLCTKITSGELFDAAYMAVNQQFEYCFGSSRKTYDTVARYILGKNGKIKDISKDLQVGVISSKDIKTIFMLTSTGRDIFNYNHVKYSGCMHDLESDKKRLEINKPIVEFICKYCYAAKLMQLEEYGSSKKIRYYESAGLKRAYNCYRDCEIKARDEAKAIFKDITDRGEVKVSWVDEKRLYTYAQLNYPDAAYKYKPEWSGDLYFDIYIPSLKLIIEYKQYFDDSTASINVERQKEEERKFEKKRRHCEEHGITFAAWDSRTAITEAAFLQFMEQYK